MLQEEENQNLPTVEEAEDAVLTRLGPDDRGELSSTVRENLREILQAMIASAKGIWIEKVVVDKHGLERKEPVYQEKPDMNTAQYLINQVMGKPKETSVDLHLKQNMIVQNEITFKKMNEKSQSDN